MFGTCAALISLDKTISRATCKIGNQVTDFLLSSIDRKQKKVLSDESSKLFIYSNSNQFTMTRGKFYRSQILDKKNSER